MSNLHAAFRSNFLHSTDERSYKRQQESLCANLFITCLLRPCVIGSAYPYVTGTSPRTENTPSQVCLLRPCVIGSAYPYVTVTSPRTENTPSQVCLLRPCVIGSAYLTGTSPRTENAPCQV
jgi:hypothetical protein